MLVVNRQGLIDAMADELVGVRELARRAHLTPKTISRMINEEIYFVRVKTLSKIRRALGCSLYQLILCDKKRSEA